jgi:8-oxo-dGTP pyrophosphatase MutT (NUDIX family)
MGDGRRTGGGLTRHDLIDRVARALAAHSARVAQRDPPCREAAVSVILKPHADDAQLLLVRRAVHGPDPWSGQIALPGGRAEPGDATLLETAMRETMEETALDLRAATLLGALDELRPRTPVLPPILVRPYVFALDVAPPLVPSVEVAELFWVNVSTLFDPARTTRARVHARGAELVVDAIELDGRVIWGMTERILRGLANAAGLG